MKKAFLYILSFLILAGCEKGSGKPDEGDLYKDTNKVSVILRIGDNITFDYDEIHLYDSSSHILYFEEIHPEFEKLKNVPFRIYADETEIYQGEFWPMYLSASPSGPYIANNPMRLQSYALKIDFAGNTPDPRNSPRLIRELIERNLLHSGISLRISTVESNGSLISFTFNITNMDKTDLFVMDPEQMGLGLFHYFTNGLSIRNINTGSVVKATITPKTPVPLNGWQPEWLTKVSPGATRSYTFMYPVNPRLGPGQYDVSFIYPGLTSQVDINKLYNNGARIWLGEVSTTKRFTIE